MEISEQVKAVVSKHYQSNHPSKKRWEEDIQKLMDDQITKNEQMTEVLIDILKMHTLGFLVLGNNVITKIQKALENDG